MFSCYSRPLHPHTHMFWLMWLQGAYTFCHTLHVSAVTVRVGKQQSVSGCRCASLSCSLLLTQTPFPPTCTFCGWYISPPNRCRIFKTIGELVEIKEMMKMRGKKRWWGREEAKGRKQGADKERGARERELWTYGGMDKMVRGKAARSPGQGEKRSQMAAKRVLTRSQPCL